MMIAQTLTSPPIVLGAPLQRTIFVAKMKHFFRLYAKKRILLEKI